MTWNDFCREFKLTLDPQQTEAVQRTEGPCLVQAVPGSGKTTVLIARLGYMGCCLGEDLDRALVVTFSKDAAAVMKNRFQKQFRGEIFGKPTFCTIHSLAYRIIRRYCEGSGREPFRVLTEPEKVIRSILKGQCGEWALDQAAEEAAGWISRAVNGKTEVYSGVEPELSGVDFAKVLEEYKRIKRQNRWMDFDDMLVYSLRILKNCPKICRQIRERFDHFCVDEAQDNSPIQNEILMMLAEGAGSLFLVGDEDQSIYGFRGADPVFLRSLAETFGEGRVLKLEHNYRSSKMVVKTAGRIISQNRGRTPKKSTGVKEDAGAVRVLRFRTLAEREEYLLRDTSSFRDFAVLARRNESLVGPSYRMFLEGRPFTPSGGMKDFFEKEPIRQILEVFCAAETDPDPADHPYYLRKILESRPLVRRLKTEKPDKALYLLMDQLGFGRYIQGRFGKRGRERAYLKLDLLGEMMAQHAGLTEFLESAAEFRKVLSLEKGTEKRRLLTCHGAKGMEFDKVYLIDVVDRIFPSCDYITHGSTDAYEEEVRLLYVALTRAKKEAEVLLVEQTGWGRFEPSVFALEIEKMVSDC